MGGFQFNGPVSFGGQPVEGDKIVVGDENGNEKKQKGEEPKPKQTSRANEGRRPGSGKTVRGEVLERRDEPPRGGQARTR